MTDSKLLETIKSLTPEECQEFALFIASPYFNRGAYTAELSSLYALILASSPDFNPEQLRKEFVHTLLFPTKSYSEGRIDRMMFEINKLAKDFLLTRHYHRPENEAHQLVDWLSILRSKGMEGRLEREYSKIKLNKENLSGASVDQCLSNFLFTKEVHEWKNVYNKVKDDIGISAAVEHLDVFYFSCRLELLNKFLLQQKATSFEMPAFMEKALASSAIPSGYEAQSPLILITWKIHALLRQEQCSLPAFKELADLLLKHENDLDAESLAQFYAYLRSLCTLLINAGNSELDLFLHTINQDNLQRGYFYNEGKISPNSVLSIVQHALRAQNVDWAYAFIQEHKNIIIGENESRDFYCLNLALCQFSEKKFTDALANIPFGSSYVFYSLVARILELKIYYETRSDILPSKIDAYKMYISRVGRKNLSTDYAELLTNFGNFVSQLGQSLPGDKKRSKQLTKRIMEKELVAERNWLLEKAIELADLKKIVTRLPRVL